MPISLQHVLAMVAGVITPPIIIAGVVGAITAFVLNIVLPRRSLADEARERKEIARADAEAAGRAEEPSLSRYGRPGGSGQCG
ncbi:hypothetical protein [Halomonas gemina]|uniref:hypothetical protein n=1 Tax=Halomonas gemina TaxID=2945105 RepID=UPI00325FB926